jgi:hypothetical protein
MVHSFYLNSTPWTLRLTYFLRPVKGRSDIFYFKAMIIPMMTQLLIKQLYAYVRRRSTQGRVIAALFDR